MNKANPLDALLGADINVEEKVFIKRLNTDFTVKALTGDKVNDLRAQCTYIEGRGANRRQVVREEELGQLLISEACINPNFNDEKLLKHYGARDGADCVQKALLAGEVARVSSAVLEVSGFDDGDEDLEEVKN